MADATAGERSATVPLSSAHGTVWLTAFRWPGEAEYAAIADAPTPPGHVRLRLQAACLTSTVFRSTMCDCAEQTAAGVRAVATGPDVVLLYLPQEGRGHGLFGKVRVLHEMSKGLPLPAAQRAAGLGASALRYDRVPDVLRMLGVESVSLLTSSPAKIEAVRAAGVPVVATEDFPAGP